MPDLNSIWFLYFVNAFQSSVFSSLSPYISSSFTAHSLSGVPTAMADAFSAAVYIPVGKIMDTWGRAEGFLVMTCFATLGLILLAACDSFAIYCTAYVGLAPILFPFYTFGLLTDIIDIGLLLHRLQWYGVLHRCHHR